MKRKILILAVALLVILTFESAVLIGFFFNPQAACMGPGGISCPTTGDIVNGRITVNASQYNLYQFGIPYGAQGINVHIRWSSGGTIGVYIMNATELIRWESGQRLHAFYHSGRTTEGAANIRVPPDDLYYLVFDNSLSTTVKNVQTSSGFSYTCNFCSVNAPIQQQYSSSAACVATNGSEICSVTLSNGGSVEASPTGACVESWSLNEGPVYTWGAPHAGVFSPTTPIRPSQNITGSCTVTGSTVPLGLVITVQVTLTNGENVDLYGPVSMNAQTCTRSGSQLVCTFSINNDFVPGVVASSCQIFTGGSTPTGAVGGTTAFNTQTHGAVFTCSMVGAEPPIGTPVSGLVRFNNGSYAEFSGRWS